jgi:DNA helicase-2/ATP-dependent DNA helicase PcrA
LGKKFVEEDDDISSRLSHVLVDEYQDTNPIQEEIYLKMCRQPPHNVTVVGDDDQALYRFRGGTVECMVNFGKTIRDRFNIKTQSIELIENYRSHGRIVNWCNEYITSFDAMIKPGARSPDKSKLIPKSKINGNYPAVSLISGESNDEVADKFAGMVKNLMENRIINDPSDCVLLMRSTRYSKNYALPFMNALSNKQIMVFNPRARNYLQQEEIQIALGAFLEIVDQNPDELVLSRDTKDDCNGWRDEYKELVKDYRYAKLKKYVDKSIQIISTLRHGQRLQSTMQDILYHILNHEPFRGWLEDPEKTFRLGELTRLFVSTVHTITAVAVTLGIISIYQSA